MMNPERCWVTNVRTIWAHLVIKHADDFERAGEELTLYREADADSEMEYAMWTALHGELAGTMTRIAREGETLARRRRVVPGSIRYLWPDAIANEMYTAYYDENG